MKKAAIRYAEILEAGAWVTHQEQEEIAKLLRKLAMTEDEAWDELERKQTKNKIKQNMNERIKELARQAGFDVEDRTNEIWFDEGWYTSIVERFAELVRQDERERLKAEGRLKYVMPKGCGKRLDLGSGWVVACGDSDMGSMPWLCKECEAIRGRTE
jgi:cupin superfamily acireductone dioxygenase involved in methionine salvage